MKKEFPLTFLSLTAACLFFYVPASGEAVRSVIDDGKCIVTVNIEAAPENDAKSWVVQETLHGIVPENIDSGGVYDPESGTIRWGAFADGSSRTLAYTLSGTDMTISPAGLMSTDGNQEAALGTEEITVSCTPPKAEQPEFNPPSGTNVPLYASISSATQGAGIRYTTDGSYPDEGAALYSGSFRIEETAVVRAIAVKADYRDSAVSSAIYLRESTKDPATSISISVSDNSTCLPGIALDVAPAPDTHSWVVEAVLPPELIPSGIGEQGVWDETHRTIRWGGFHDASPTRLSFDVEGEDGTHTLEITGSFNGLDERCEQEVAISCPRVAAPTFEPASGTEAPVTVAVACETDGAEIRYTTDGTEPNINSTIYSAPISINSSTTLKAIAFKTGLMDSKISTATYPSGPPKAVVLAAGGPYATNFLWNASLDCSLHAYRALKYKGYTRDTIYFMSSDMFLDADGDGKPNDIDGLHTLAQLEYALTDWAKTAGKLFLYMTDHGGYETFRINESETLSAATLDGWLDTLQETMLGQLVVVIDSCQSGSFVSCLKPPAGKNRIVIASSTGDQPSYFLQDGKLSFSFQFWSSVFSGSKLREAFYFGRDMMQAYQGALVDSNGDGIPTHNDAKYMCDILIGRDMVVASDIPAASETCLPSALLEPQPVDLCVEIVSALNPIQRVWAVVATPDSGTGNPENPVMALEEFDLAGPSATGVYTGTYSDISTLGTYTFSIYAKDSQGMYSLPVVRQVHRIDEYPEGDANHDGTVDLADAMALLSILTGTSDSPVYPNADLDGDGVLGITDVTAIMRSVVEK